MLPTSAASAGEGIAVVMVMQVIVQTASGRRVGHVARVELAVEEVVVVVCSYASAATPREDRVDRNRYGGFQLHCGATAATTDQ
jgi:hypothetical protein